MIENLIVNYGTEISLFLRVLSLIVLGFFCIPLQWQEYGVKNGLHKLRTQLLIFGVILLITNIVTMFFLWDIIANNIPQKPVNASLQIFNGAAFLAMSSIGYSVYRQQYSDESKEEHSFMADRKQAKDDRELI